MQKIKIVRDERVQVGGGRGGTVDREACQVLLLRCHLSRDLHEVRAVAIEDLTEEYPGRENSCYQALGWK